MPPYVTTKAAEKYREAMSQPDLVFLTRENQDAMIDKAKQEACTHDFDRKSADELCCRVCGLIAKASELDCD